MHSCAWINGQYQQVGPQSSQSSQAATQLNHDPMWTLQAGTANNSCQYRTWNTDVQPLQSSHLTFRNGAYYKRQAPNWQTSASPHQAVSSKQQAGGETNSYYPTVQNSLTNIQSENPRQNSGFIISPTQIPPNTKKANTTYPQQNMSAQHQRLQAHWKQSVRQDGNVGSVQRCTLLREMLLKSVESNNPVPAYTTVSASQLHQEVSMAHNTKTPHNQNERQHGTQHGHFLSTATPSYDMAVSQSHTNNSIMTNSLSSKQDLVISSTSQKTQQYPTHLNSTPNYETCRFLSKTNELPLNPAADPQEQRLRRQMITRIAEDLQKSYPARSDGCPPVHTSPSYREKQQPVTLTVSESYNSRPSQSLSLTSEPSPPKTIHSVTSRTQQGVDASQQSSVSNIFYVTATGDGISQTTVKANDGSIHSSPSRTGMRAVAVVQPLSQESYQVASRHMSSNTINRSAELLREGSNWHPEKPNQMRSNISTSSHSAASTDSTFVSPSHGHQNCSQKQLSADDTEPEPAINMQVDQRVVPTAQQLPPSKVPARTSSSSDSDQSETPSDPRARVFELSSIPTLPWTPHLINKLVERVERDQVISVPVNSTTMSDSASKILGMYWNGSSKNLASKLKAGWYRDLITQVMQFCTKYVTQETVILSQVKGGFNRKLKKYVLKDDEVYSLPPYKSSWLNVNEKLDDIDKEYGHSWSLKHHLHVPEIHSQPDRVGTVDSVPAPSVSEVPIMVSSQTEAEPVDSGEEKQASTREATSTQAVSPNDTETEDSSDPFYSFEITVLPPEEAKAIFNQTESQTSQSMDTDSQLEGVTNTSVEGELPEAIDVASNDSKREEGSVCPIEQVCCLSRWLEIICRSSIPSMTCECKHKQSAKVQKEDNLHGIESEGKNQAKDGENIMTDSRPELCSELIQTIVFTENDLKTHSCSDKDSKNISHVSIDNSQSNIIFISDDELSSRDDEIKSIPAADCVQVQFNSTESTQSCFSVGSDKETENLPTSESEVACQMLDLLNCEQAQLTSSDVAKSSLETKEQAQISATATFSLSGKHETVVRKRRRLSSGDRCFPFLKKAKKCKPPVDVESRPSLEGVHRCGKVSVDATDSEFKSSNARAVQLVLFGSVPQDKCVSIGSKQRNSVPGAEVQRPPEVLTVKLSPLKRKSSEIVPTGEHSVKRRIYEKWRRSLAPIKMKHRLKLKTQKSTFVAVSGVSFKKAEAFSPFCTKRLPVSDETSSWNRNTTRCMSLKRRRARSNDLKCREGKAGVTHQERSNAENGSRAFMALQENNVLKFSVLPKTFTFNGKKDTSDTVPNEPALAEDQQKSPNNSSSKTMGTWYPNPEKKYHPLHSPPVPKTSSLFHEFQKKYKKKTQPSKDE